MSNFPNSYDDDTTLPPINDNIQDIGGEAINAVRDAIFNTEQYLGLGGAGTTASISERLGISIDADGNIKSSAITGLGLVTLPITNDQISDVAAIPESKLKLDHRTQDLFNYIQDLVSGINKSLGWISTTGIKLEPHLFGTLYRHILQQIDVSNDPNQFLRNKFSTLRNNTNSYNLIKDINDELITHQFVDGTPSIFAQDIVTFGGSTYPSNYGHTASGIFINTSRFATIPQTVQDLQQLANFIDSTNLFLIGTRLQNLYNNGISRSSRCFSLSEDGYGQSIIPNTLVTTYLLNDGVLNTPFDDINTGDDIIEFKPNASEINSNSFDEKFALVKIGDIIRVNYGSVEVQFLVKEKKYIQSGGNKIYLVRINGKNLFYSTMAMARIDRPLFNINKFGVLSVSAANNNFSEIPSLIIGSPRGAQALGIGFDPNLFDSTHYNLYLVLYPTGNLSDEYIVLPPIDVTGNQGVLIGKYTLEYIVKTTNNILRQNGYNYRFAAFSHQGEFGIMLADSYNNASFSIVSGIVDSNGNYDQAATSSNFPNNVVGLFPGSSADPLGFGPSAANIASPTLSPSYASAEAALIPTKIFIPLKRNTYYVNGTEKEKLNIDINQFLDLYGDGYWVGTIQAKQIFPGSPPMGRVQTTYRIFLDLSASQLKAGKTLVVQSLGQTGLVNFGRFIIQSITFSLCAPDIYTDITVYDAVHATGISPVNNTLDIGSQVAIYFNSDSVSFNKETATDFTNITSTFKRYFEVYIDQNAHTFTHERGRISSNVSNIIVNGVNLYTSSEINKLNIIKISSKLRGYQFGPVNKITLKINNLDTVTGTYSGFLSFYDGSTFAHLGPLTVGKIGEITRFYDETNIDYIDIIYDIDAVISNFTNMILDFQLFPTLSLDDEIMLIGNCQLNDIINTIDYLKDERQFGNVSEKQLTNSALNFISLGEKLLHTNGVIRGFDVIADSDNIIELSGGTILVDGKFININNRITIIPPLRELYQSVSYDIIWALCINSIGELVTIPLTDFDSTLSNPNAPNRVFTVFNPSDGSTYNLDANTFSNIIENRKDLAILHVIYSFISGSGKSIGISLSIRDARKFINDGDSVFPITWTSDTAQGNFRTLQAINTWLKFNGTFNNIVKVRGTFNITSTLILDYTNVVEFIGDGTIFNVLTVPGILIGKNVKIKNIQFNFMYNPVGDGTYIPSNLINYTRGLIDITSGVNSNVNISIEDCIFNTFLSDRYPLITIKLNSNSYIVQDLIIKNNKFVSKTTTSDIRAAIVIVSTYSSFTLTNAKLIDVIIDNNIFNQDQMIIITAVDMAAPPSAVNCFISKNICGSIAFTTRFDIQENFTNPDTNFIRNKIGCLYVQENTCKFMGTLNSDGYTFQGTGFSSNSGRCIIRHNTLSWLHLDAHQSTVPTDIIGRGIIIEHNTFNAFDTSFLNNFIGISGVLSNYAYFDLSGVGVDYSNNIEIFGNTFNSIIGIASNSTTTLYNYLNHINTAHSVKIIDNIFNGIVNDSVNSTFIKFNYGSSDAPSAIVTNNKFYKHSNSINKYIDNSGTVGNFIINNNFFDSFTTGSSTTLSNLGSSALSPIYYNNKNQTDTLLVRGYMGTTTIAPFGSGFMNASGESSLITDSYVSVHQSFVATLRFAYLDTNVDTRMHWFIPLIGLLPLGVRIISVSVFATGTDLVATQKSASLILSNASGTSTTTVSSLGASGSILSLAEGIDFSANSYVNYSSSVLAVEFEFRASHNIAFTPTLSEITIIYRY